MQHSRRFIRPPRQDFHSNVLDNLISLNAESTKDDGERRPGFASLVSAFGPMLTPCVAAISDGLLTRSYCVLSLHRSTLWAPLAARSAKPVPCLSRRNFLCSRQAGAGRGRGRAQCCAPHDMPGNKRGGWQRTLWEDMTIRRVAGLDVEGSRLSGVQKGRWRQETLG